MKVYDMITAIRPALERLNEHGIEVSNVKNMVIYDEYMAMLSNGDKKMFIVAYLADKYKKSESAITRIIKRLSEDI